MQHDERTAGRRVEPEELLGRVLRDEFRLDACLGAGGMSVVYRARQLTVDRDVVVKVMSTPSTRAAEFRQRFVQEARTASRVNHPGIVTIYSFGEEEGVGSFIAMELVDGVSLRALAANGPLDVPRASGLIAQVCRAMHAAHIAGIIHRDLKPDNVMVERREGREVARVLDFGIAKPSDALVTTLDEHVVGTPDYMAPEQARKRPVDARTDVYSVGIILYELVFGRRPYDAPDPLALMFKHVSAPLPLDDFDPSWPSELRGVFETACAKDPDDRYATAMEMAIALDTLSGVMFGDPVRSSGPISDAAIETVSTPGEGVTTDPMGDRFEMATTLVSPSDSVDTGPRPPVDVEESIETTVHSPVVSSRPRGGLVGLAVVLLAGAGAVFAGVKYFGGPDASQSTDDVAALGKAEPIEPPVVETVSTEVDESGVVENEEEPLWRASVAVQNATSRATGVAEGVARGQPDDVGSAANAARPKPTARTKDTFEFERVKLPEKKKPKLLSIE